MPRWLRKFEKQFIRPVAHTVRDVAPVIVPVVAIIATAGAATPAVTTSLVASGVSATAATVVAPIITTAAASATVTAVQGGHSVDIANAAKLGVLGTVAGPVVTTAVAIQHENVERALVASFASAAVSVPLQSSPAVVQNAIQKMTAAAITREQPVLQAGVSSVLSSATAQAVNTVIQQQACCQNVVENSPANNTDKDTVKTVSSETKSSNVVFHVSHETKTRDDGVTPFWIDPGILGSDAAIIQGNGRKLAPYVFRDAPSIGVEPFMCEPHDLPNDTVTTPIDPDMQFIPNATYKPLEALL